MAKEWMRGVECAGLIGGGALGRGGGDRGVRGEADPQRQAERRARPVATHDGARRWEVPTMSRGQDSGNGTPR